MQLLTNWVFGVIIQYTLKGDDMTVYVVMGGMSYDGEYAESVRVFVTREDAVQYGEGLVSSEEYHYYEIVAAEVG